MKFTTLIALIFLLVSCQERDRSQHSHRSDIKFREVATTNNNILHAKDDEDNSLEDSSLINRKNVGGKVVRIIDGDTFVLLLDNDFETNVRLNGIDCPEKKQAFSKRAKKELSDLVFEKSVTVYYDKKDGFGRVLGEVLVDGINVNQEMMRRGMAWHFKKYSDDEVLSNLEKEARDNRVGLWSEPNPVRKELSQSDRLAELNRVAITQMKSLLESNTIKKLK